MARLVDRTKLMEALNQLDAKANARNTTIDQVAIDTDRVSKEAGPILCVIGVTPGGELIQFFEPIA